MPIAEIAVANSLCVASADSPRSTTHLRSPSQHVPTHSSPRGQSQRFLRHEASDSLCIDAKQTMLRAIQCKVFQYLGIGHSCTEGLRLIFMKMRTSFLQAISGSTFISLRPGANNRCEQFKFEEACSYWDDECQNVQQCAKSTASSPNRYVCDVHLLSSLRSLSWHVPKA